MKNDHAKSFRSIFFTMISIVVPAYNEEDSLPLFHKRISDVLKKITENYEIVYVNDGSTDRTLAVMHELFSEDHHVAIVDLSRNFGKELALTAGLDFAKGNAVVVIDADLQDPPELIPDLVRRWQEGYDVVYAKRIARDGESAFKKLTSYLFYRVMHILSSVEIPQDTGDFRLISRRALDALKTLRESNRFMKGLFAWVGFPQISVEYNRAKRVAGKTKWNYWRLWNFALEGITSFTTAPLKLAIYIGFLVSLTAFIYAVFVITRTLLFGDSVAGYPSLMAVILFLGGVQLFTLGIIGEYLSRTFSETKNRPLYVVKEYISFEKQKI